MQVKDKIKKLLNFSRRYRHAILIATLIICIALPRIIDGLTSVYNLALKYHEKSKYEYRVGAICNDGWQSNATGRGACSHHGGVKVWKYKTAYKKTWSECIVEAEKRSWIE